jgi:biotin transporter BioY
MASQKARNVKLIGITVIGVIAERIAAKSDKFMLFLVICLGALIIFVIARALYRSFS